MKANSETILYCEFYDHASSTNAWQEYKEILIDLDPKKSVMKAVGKIIYEDDIGYRLTTMWGEDCAGSGHLIIKSTIVREIKWNIPSKHPKKPVLKTLQ
jgi:hypothetical protein